MAAEKTDKDFDSSLNIITGELKNKLTNLPSEIKRSTAEIRLRIGKPVVLFGKSGSVLLSGGQGITKDVSKSYIFSSKEMKDTFSRICSYSIHSHLQSIINGFITIQGGHRVGICATAVTDNKSNITSVRDISSLNIRIAREVTDCSKVIYNTLYHSNLKSIIIAGPPMSGKTTVLRDLLKNISNGRHMGKVCVIDERQEIAAMNSGFCQKNVGINTDVFDLYPKETAVTTALRTMSPEVIAMDELCSEKEIDAIELAANSGVKFIVTVHAADYTEILNRNQIYRLLRTYSFENLVLLKKNVPGEVEAIFDAKELLDEIIRRNIGINGYDSYGSECFLTA